MVHADATDFGALAMVEAEGREKVCRWGMYGGVVSCCGGAVGEGAGDDTVVDVLRAGEGREGGFEREGVL